MKENMFFYFTTHSTNFILRLYGVGHMVNDHLDCEKERKSAAASTWVILFLISK